MTSRQCSIIRGQINDKGIDKRGGNGVVYKNYMSHCQPALDMPLDLIYGQVFAFDIDIHSTAFV